MNKNHPFLFALLGGAVVVAVDAAITMLAAKVIMKDADTDDDIPDYEEAEMPSFGGNSDVDAEDFFADQKTAPPQLDVSALQEIRRNAYTTGHEVGKREGYSAGYAQGCADTAAAADMKVDTAYMEGKLDGYDGNCPPEPPETDDDENEPNAPTDNEKSDADNPANDNDAEVEHGVNITDPNDVCHKIVNEIMSLWTECKDTIIYDHTACVIRAMIYAKEFSEEEHGNKATLQTVADALYNIENSEKFCDVVTSSGNEDALAELDQYRRASQNLQGNALVSAKHCLREYLEKK